MEAYIYVPSDIFMSCSTIELKYTILFKTKVRRCFLNQNQMFNLPWKTLLLHFLHQQLYGILPRAFLRLPEKIFKKIRWERATVHMQAHIYNLTHTHTHIYIHMKIFQVRKPFYVRKWKTMASWLHTISSTCWIIPFPL